MKKQTPTIAIAATFSAELVENSLNFWLKELEIEACIEFAPFNQVFQQLLDPASLLATNQNGINVLLIRLEDWLAFDDLRRAAADASLQARLCRAVEQHVQDFVEAQEAAAAANCRVPWLVCFCPTSDSLRQDRPLASIIEAMESRAVSLCRKIPNTYPVSGAELAAMYPIASLYDQLSDELARVPYTPLFFTALGTMIVRRLYALQSLPRKVIVLDCDRTLWAGNCAEDGAEGVGIDEPRRVFQEFLLAQQRAGMLLCLCSRNNEPDVLDVFRRHAGMVLKLEHLVAWRINWLPKSRNLQSLANQLGLGLESFIFIDDDPFQCAEVAAACPQVLSLPLPDESREIPGFLAHVWAFDRLKPPSSEDRNRTRYYRSDMERQVYRQQTTSLVDFLAGLRLQVRFEILAPHHYARVSQLTLRTNQFNLTTRRRSESEVQRLFHSGQCEGLCVEVSDRFGDYGLVGALIFKAEKEAFEVDTFLLSCRALGRGVEHQMLARLGEAAGERGLKWINVPCLPTPKNQPGRDFLDSTGAAFRETSGPGFLYRFPAAHAANVCYLPAAGAEADLAAGKSSAQDIGSTEPREIDGLAMESPLAGAPSSTMNRIARELNSAESIFSRIEAQRIQARPNVGTEFVAPGNPIETQLAAIWQEILGCDRVGIHDNFFEMGGHSILMIRLISRIRDAFEVEVPIRTFFESPTVADVAAIISRIKIQQTDRDLAARLLKQINRMSDSEVEALLVRKSSVLSSQPSPARNATEHPPEQIHTMTFPTMNRVATLKRGLISYIENGQHHGRSVDYVVMDDSPARELRRAYRQMLQQVQSRYGASILYAGMEERMQFAERLVASGDLPANIVKFALLNLENSSYSAGACRNAILLHTAGELCFCVDDDTLCRIAPSPNFRRGLRITEAFSPEEHWFYPNLESAIETLVFDQQDPLAIQGDFLARNVAVLRNSAEAGRALELDKADAPPTRQLAERDGKVLVTLNGVAGDCGWNAPFGWWGLPMGYLMLNGASREQLLQTEAHYRSACVSRHQVRVVDLPTLGRNSLCIATSVGLDNRALLPPFMPVLRGEDVLFGIVLEHCYKDGFIAHLPWALVHAPTDPRAFNPGELFRSASGYDMARLLNDCIASRSGIAPGVEPSEALMALGKHLEQLGSMPQGDFVEFVQVRALASCSRYLQSMESSLRAYQESPAFWAADMRKYMELMRRYLTSDLFAVPLDLFAATRSAEAAMAAAQRYVSQFGTLLAWWPALVKTAQQLRRAECFLAKPVNSRGE